MGTQASAPQDDLVRRLRSAADDAAMLLDDLKALAAYLPGSMAQDDLLQLADDLESGCEWLHIAISERLPPGPGFAAARGVAAP